MSTRRGLSLKELAGAVGAHDLQVANCGRGTCFPTVGKVIAKALRVAIDRLAGEIDADEGHARYLRLLRRLRELEALPKDDQDVAVKLIDALIANDTIMKLVS